MKSTKPRQLLLCGLDNAGKTTMLKQYSSGLESYASSPEAANHAEDKFANTEFFMTTPFIDIEKIDLPETSQQCIVYDLSGQVSS